MSINLTTFIVPGGRVDRVKYNYTRIIYSRADAIRLTRTAQNKLPFPRRKPTRVAGRRLSKNLDILCT